MDNDQNHNIKKVNINGTSQSNKFDAIVIGSLFYQGVIVALQKKFPAITGPKHDDICYATQNRQDAVKSLAIDSDLMLVVGSVNSSNSNRLREVAEIRGDRAYMVDGPDDLEQAWFEGVDAIGVTAGASAPEVLVSEVVQGLQAMGASAPLEMDGRAENITFSMTRELRIPATPVE